MMQHWPALRLPHDAKLWRTVLVAGVVGSLSAAGGLFATCEAERECRRRRTCDSPHCSPRGGCSWCAFRTRPSVAFANHNSRLPSTAGGGAAAQNFNSLRAELATMLRGTCSAGERMADSAGPSGPCVPFYPYPDALNVEIADPAAATAHERACGAWLAGGLPDEGGGPVARAWQDHQHWVETLRAQEGAATASSHAATDAMGKFRRECERTELSGPAALQQAGRIAYEYLVAPADAIATRDDLLRASGLLASHHCAGSVTIAPYLAGNGRFVPEALGGHTFSDGVLAEALYGVGEPEAVRLAAERASLAVNARMGGGGAPPVLSDTDMLHAMHGATDGSLFGIGAIIAPSVESSVLAALVEHFDANPEEAKSYVKGVAAFCSLTLRVHLDAFGELTNDLQKTVSEIHAAYLNAWPRAATLGRVEADGRDGGDDDGDGEGALGPLGPRGARQRAARVNASITRSGSITLAQLPLPESVLSADARRLQTQSGATDACMQLMRGLFPDEVDRARFDATISPGLYARLEVLAEEVREGTAKVFEQSAPLRGVLHDPDAVAADVRGASIRFAGAPRGSWAGASRPLVDAGLQSHNGVFMQALSQSRKVFLDRIVGLASPDADACDHPPLRSSVAVNAYMLPGLKCTVLMLGVAHRPWLDEQYDDESLLGRGLAVLAHELGHLTLNVNFHADALAELLSDYPESTHTEAIADVVAVLGVVATGKVPPNRALAHWCQLWCARWPITYQPRADGTHPDTNERCDRLHATLLRITPDMGWDDPW